MYTHLVEHLQEQDVRQPPPPINEDSVEFNVLGYGVDDKRVSTRHRDEIGVIALVGGNGDLIPL
jgi:hypothetical protein